MKAFSFEGKGFEYFKIWIVNILLTVVTLSLYHPWAKVRNKRYFFANSTLEGRNFEYHATGKQLFVGYLISMALLIAYIVIQKISPIGSLILILLFFVAFPWIIWRSLKFNMGVSSFSNVRFGFDGKLGGAYFVYMLLPILTFLSVYFAPVVAAIVLPKYAGSMGVVGGLAIAFLVIFSLALSFYMYGLLKKKSYTYALNGYRYGQGKFATKLAVAPFVKIALKTLALFILTMFAYMMFVGLISALLGSSTSLLGLVGNMNDPEAIMSTFQNPAVIILLVLVYAGFILISIAVFAYSTARQRAYIYKNTSLDKKIRFKSTLGATQLAWVSVTNLLMILVTLGLAIPWAAVRIARLYLINTKVDTRVGLDSYVSQKQEQQSALGDQIGDAFDVDVGIGI